MYRSLIAKLLPDGLLGIALRIVREYRLVRRRAAPNISEVEFRRILCEELGIHSGATVFVHSSLGAMNIGFPPHKVLNLLMDVVGPEGTLLFPCTHLTEGPESFYMKGGTFDVDKSATTSGLLSEFARRRKDAFRSLHPTHSVVAIGKHARIMTESHGESIHPFGERSPYYMLIHYDSLIVGLGVDTRAMTFVHCVEDLMGDEFPVPTYKGTLLRARIRDHSRVESEATSLIHNDRADQRDIPRYVKRHVSPGACRDFKMHGVPYFLARPVMLLREMEDLARKGITIYGR